MSELANNEEEEIFFDGSATCRNTQLASLISILTMMTTTTMMTASFCCCCWFILITGCYPTWAFFSPYLLSSLHSPLLHPPPLPPPHKFSLLPPALFVCFWFTRGFSWPCKTFSWPCKTQCCLLCLCDSCLCKPYTRIYWGRVLLVLFFVPAQLMFSFLVYPSWAIWNHT